VSIEQARAAVRCLTRSSPGLSEDQHGHPSSCGPALPVSLERGPIMGPALALFARRLPGVQLIVAANVANLPARRAVSRQKEIAIRLAAGAAAHG